MKVIHVLSSFVKAGGERVVVELANKAVENGEDITIIAGWPIESKDLQNDIDPRVKIKFIGKTKSLAYVKTLFWIVSNKKWICSHDILHCHLTYGAVFGSIVDIVLRKIFFEKGPRIVETYHAVSMPIPAFNRWLHSRMMLLRDGLVFMQKDGYWDNFIQKHPRLKIEIIPNGISPVDTKKYSEQQQQFRKKLGLPDNCKYIVGTVSHLRTDRRPWLYVPIFRDIHQAFGSDVHFILVGDGVESDRIKMLFKQQGLAEYVHMPGFINNTAIVLPNIDIYVSVSVGEAAGISMIEAAMCKVPVIGIQFVENYQAKDEDWVWSHTDTKEVAKRIIFLLQNAEERNKLATDQYKYVNDHFTTEAMYASYISFYQEVLAKK